MIESKQCTAAPSTCEATEVVQESVLVELRYQEDGGMDQSDRNGSEFKDPSSSASLEILALSPPTRRLFRRKTVQIYSEDGAPRQALESKLHLPRDQQLKLSETIKLFTDA
jgi:hypothetical protein